MSKQKRSRKLLPATDASVSLQKHAKHISTTHEYLNMFLPSRQLIRANFVRPGDGDPPMDRWREAEYAKDDS